MKHLLIFAGKTLVTATLFCVIAAACTVAFPFLCYVATKDIFQRDLY